MSIEAIAACKGVELSKKHPLCRYVVATVRHNSSQRTVVRLAPVVAFVHDILFDIGREAPGTQVERLGVGFVAWVKSDRKRRKPSICLTNDNTGLAREPDTNATAAIVRTHFRGRKVTVN